MLDEHLAPLKKKRPAIYKKQSFVVRFQILNRPLGFQHFPFLPLGVNLPLVIPTSLLPLFHLSLEGPDHQEEIGLKQPVKDAQPGPASQVDVRLMADYELADYEPHDI